MSEPNSENFAGYGKRCLMVFGVVMCVTLMMVGIFYAHLPNHALSIALTLVAACVNAAFVAGYLMHLVSERKMTFIVLAFTAIFFVGLLGLTLGARMSVPQGTIH
jgi:hypothetical membrane protein